MKKALLPKNSNQPKDSRMSSTIFPSSENIKEGVIQEIFEIFLPEKESIGRCFLDAELVSPSEAKNIAEQGNIFLPRYKGNDLLIYDRNNRFSRKQNKKLFTPRKNDYVIADDGSYIRFDGKVYVCYSPKGEIIGSF